MPGETGVLLVDISVQIGNKIMLVFTLNPIWYVESTPPPPPASFLLITLKRLNGFELNFLTFNIN